MSRQWDEHTEKVLQHVRETRGWYLTDVGHLRRKAWPWWQSLWRPYVVCCPISSMANKWGSEYGRVARDVGIDRDRAIAIVHAADDSGWQPDLRAALLEAAGVEEK